MFTHGDTDIIRHLYRFRFLRSGQLAKLCGRSNQSVRRRCRELTRLTFIAGLERAPMEEMAYTLGPEGYRFIANELKVDVKDLPFSRNAAKTASQFWLHTLLVNDTAVSLHLAAETHSEFVLKDVIHEFQLQDPRAKEKHKKFLLSEKLTEGNKIYSFRPDCLFIVYGETGGLGNSMALFLEADRGSEAIGRIEAKYEAYRVFYERGLYHQNFDCVGMRCLFVLEGVKGKGRIISMRRRLEAMRAKYDSDFAHIFRFTHRDLLNDETIIDSPVWQDVSGRLHPLYKPKGLELGKLLHEHREFLTPFYGKQAIDRTAAEA